MPKFASVVSSFLILLCAACAFCEGASAQAASTDVPLVKIDTGSISGVTADGVTSFKAIPYAAPPVGALRWRMPQPAKPWVGVLKTDKFGPSCMQTDNIPKSEDCLTLNVWRPAAASAAPLPVMVWIYGGALVHGRASLYPLDAIARQGVVAVSMNYRMGRFGFFAHPALASEAPGRCCAATTATWTSARRCSGSSATSRPSAAIRTTVTIFGESAGGGSVMVASRPRRCRAACSSAPSCSRRAFPPRARRSLPLTEPCRRRENRGRLYPLRSASRAMAPQALTALRALPAEQAHRRAPRRQEEIAALSAGRPSPAFAGAIRRRKACRRSARSRLRRRPAGHGAGHRRRQRPRPPDRHRQQQGRTLRRVRRGCGRRAQALRSRAATSRSTN